MPILKIYADSKGPGQCRSCGAAITWAELTSGKRHPFDGEIVAVRSQGSILEGRVIEDIDTSITRSHFESCPDAKDWRKRK
jgi:hypothetical protein